jgi:hypothetical protein
MRSGFNESLLSKLIDHLFDEICPVNREVAPLRCSTSYCLSNSAYCERIQEKIEQCMRNWELPNQTHGRQ